MTREDAISRLMGLDTFGSYQHRTVRRRLAEEMVDSLIALGLLKVEVDNAHVPAGQ